MTQKSLARNSTSANREMIMSHFANSSKLGLDQKKDNILCFGKIKRIMAELKFSREHEWVKIENGIAVIGISEFAQEQLDDIVSIELPKLGSIFKKGQTVALVDSVKASSDIYAPISGEIVEVNNGLIEKPETINQSPYELGWILRIRPSNIEEFESLMTEEQYDRYIGEIK